MRVQFADLGVVATVGAASRCAISKNRAKQAAARFDRVGRLPVDFDTRCRLGAASGAGMGVFGANCGAPPLRELRALRSAARRAACHGATRAAQGVIFGLHSKVWRLDPMAVVTLAPLLHLAKAVRRGWLEAEVLQQLASAYAAGHGPSAGPLAAAVRSMQTLGIHGTLLEWRRIGPGAALAPCQP